MSNASSSPPVLSSSSSFSGVNVGTVNTTAISVLSEEIDYTLYFRIMSILLFVMASALISGFAALTGAVKSLAQSMQDRRRHAHRAQAQDVEAYPATSHVDEHGCCEKAPAAETSELDHDLEGNSSDSCTPPHSSSPAGKQRGPGRKLWKKVQHAVSNRAWPTYALNAAGLAVACVFSGPPSLQYNLPTPVTDPGRSS